jgi:hypothetical protein
MKPTSKEYNKVTKLLKAQDSKFWGLMVFEKEKL